MTTLAADSFTRTVSAGWGTADTGGAWTVTNSIYFSTDGSRGLVKPTAGNTAVARLPGVSSTTVDETVSFGISALPVGGTLYCSVRGRSFADTSSATTSYGALVTVAPTGVVSLYLQVNGVSSILTATGVTITAADRVNVHVRVTGTSPTRIQARVWKAGAAEPTSWQLDATDSTAGLQAAGSLAISTFLASAVTNGPLTVSWDDLSATNVVTLVPPTADVTANVDVIDASRSSAKNGGTLSFAISPTTGVRTLAAGIWQAPIPAAGSANQPYTVTVTETLNGSTATANGNATIVAAQATSAAPSGPVYFTKVRVRGAWV